MAWMTTLWPVYRTMGQLLLDLTTASTILGFCWYTWSGHWDADTRATKAPRKEAPR